MTEIPDHSVDLVLVDPPYGTTRCKWDTVIPLAPMWEQIRRVAKERAAVVIHASQPFASALIMSNPRDFRYCWIWEKPNATGYFNARRRPLVAHEELCVFAREANHYYPQKTTGHKRAKTTKPAGRLTENYGSHGPRVYDSTERYPRSVQKFKSQQGWHPTQKPAELAEYMIRTYTQPGQNVLDFTMGSGTTGVAAMQSGRHFVGIEQDPKYFEIATQRIEQASED